MVEFRPVVGFEGLYEVSDTGVVRRSATNRIGKTYFGKILKPSVDHDGYLRVCLFKDKRCNDMTVHKLVAYAFLGPRPLGYQINHLDGNKANPNLSNLEYCTQSENLKHCFKLRPELKAIAARSSAYGRSTPQFKEALRKWNSSEKLHNQLRSQAKEASVASKTPEAIQKWRESRSGYVVSPETCAKISASQLGKKKSPESIEKMRRSKIGSKYSEESKLKRKATWARKRESKLALKKEE